VQIVCLDLEGVLVPEIWIEFATRTGIPELRRTTRDEPDYDKLMKYRLAILTEHKLGLPDIQKVIAEMGPLDGARAFVDGLREDYQVIILSDTFYEFAHPLMRQLGWPTLFCHSLEADADGMLVNYHLRMPDQKKEAVRRFKELNFTVVAAGDSYNDTAMLGEAHAGILFHPPENVIDEFPQFPVTHPTPNCAPRSTRPFSPRPPRRDAMPRAFLHLSASCPDQIGIIARVSGFIAEHEAGSSNQAITPTTAAARTTAAISCASRSRPIRCPFTWPSSASASAARRRSVDGLEDQRLGGEEARRDHGQQAGALPLRPAGALAVEGTRHRDSLRDLESRHLQGLRRMARHPLPPRAGQPRQQAGGLRRNQRIYDEVKGDTMVLARYMQILSPELCAATRGR
jgi:phosphoserine/homoserine phosphotransferase